jgi:hypothetical protein
LAPLFGASYNFAESWKVKNPYGFGEPSYEDRSEIIEAQKGRVGRRRRYGASYQRLGPCALVTIPARAAETSDVPARRQVE